MFLRLTKTRSRIPLTWLKGIAISLTTCFLILQLSPLANAQFLGGTEGVSNLLPSGVTRNGNVETTDIKSSIDGRFLFTIASPAVRDRTTPSDILPVEIRAEQVTATLERIIWRVGVLQWVQTLKNQDLPTPKVVLAQLNNLTILQIVLPDIQSEETQKRFHLITVTSLDADYHGLEVEALAQEWQGILEEELARAMRLYSQNALLKRTFWALRALVIILAISLLLWGLQRLLRRYRQRLQQQQEQELVASSEAEEAETETGNYPSPSPEATPILENLLSQRESFLATLRTHFNDNDSNNLVRFAAWLLFWLQIITLYGGISWIVSIHPLLMQWQNEVAGIPLKLLIIWCFISFSIRLSYSLIDRFTQAWGRTDFLSDFLPIAEIQRKKVRELTIAGVLRGVAFTGLLGMGIIWSLDLVNVPTSSILAGGAILGLALSFGAQSLVKDLVNGGLILIEDQFAVGDVIDLGDASGFVEDLNLRVTLLRDASGSLIAIPNSSIVRVKNLTRLWSRVDFTVEIAYDADLNRAFAVLKKVGEGMLNDPEWRDCLLEPPDILGVENLAHTGILLRVWIKTEPLQQWAVGREYRYRVWCAFGENQIAIGRPEWISYTTELAPTVQDSKAAEGS